MNKRFEQSELAYTDTSATHTSLLADIKHQLEEHNTIMNTGRFEMGELSSKLDV